MQPIDQKIKDIINTFNLNNFSFSKRIGVTGTTIDSIVNGRPQADGSRKRTKPGYDVLMAIINEFNINPDYLFGKSDVMLKDGVPTYSGIPEIISTTHDSDKNVVYVPVKARAEYLDRSDDDDYIESLLKFHMPKLQNERLRCFEVQGNAMIPTFIEGDLVFGSRVENFSDIKNGNVYVVVSKNDGVVFKRVINTTEERGKLILKSDNKDGNYPTYGIAADDIKEIWCVAMFASKQIPEPVNVNDRLHELESKIIDLEEIVFKKTKN